MDDCIQALDKNVRLLRGLDGRLHTCSEPLVLQKLVNPVSQAVLICSRNGVWDTKAAEVSGSAAGIFLLAALSVCVVPY